MLGLGTDLLKEIEIFMNNDKDEAVKKAVSKKTLFNCQAYIDIKICVF